MESKLIIAKKVATLAIYQMKGRYRKTIAGFLWVTLNPIMMFTVQAIIFKHILKFVLEDYFVFLLGGLLPWLFITSTVQMSVTLFVSSGPLLKSFRINPLELLSAKVLDNFFNFVFSFFLIISVMFFFYDFASTVIFVPLCFLLLLVFTFILTSFLGILHVFFRDTAFVASFVFQIAYFVTPIFYPREILPSELQRVVDFNPFYILIRPFQSSLYGGDPKIIITDLITASVMTSLLILLTVFFWKKNNERFYLQI